MVQAGQYVTDGTAVFIVTDIRDGLQVGDIKLSPILRSGYVKANGAQLSHASTNYPRLITFVTDNPSLLATDDTAWASNKALYVYDSVADTLRVPDCTDRVLQGGSTVESKEAGLPNITGQVGSFRQNVMQNIGTGAFHTDMNTQGTYVVNVTQTSTNNEYLETMDASGANTIYGSSTTVQQSALAMIPQIRY